MEQYGGLNVTGPDKLIGSGTIRSCGLVKGSVITMGFEVPCAQVTSSDTDHFLLSANQDVKLSAPSPAPCLPTHFYVPPW